MIEPGKPFIVRTVDSAQAALVRALMLAGFEQLKDLDPPSSAFGETEDDVAAAIRRGGAAIAWQDDVPVGTVRWEPEAGCLYIGRLAVIPQVQRRGVATALMDVAEAVAPQLGMREAQVEMRSVLGGNQSFFRGLGYAVMWVRPHPRNPEFTTVRMRKSLA